MTPKYLKHVETLSCAGAELETHVPRWMSTGPGLGREIPEDGFSGGITASSPAGKNGQYCDRRFRAAPT